MKIIQSYFTLFFILLLVIATPSQIFSSYNLFSNTNLTYIPLVIHPISTQTRINDLRFGVGLSSYDESAHIGEIENAGAGWMYSNELAIRWSDFEPNKAGEYDLSDPNAGGDRMRWVEQQIINANARKFRVIQTINSAPKWAVPAGNGNCGPIQPEYYGAFSEFVKKIVRKYSQQPYNIKHWEIFSQPDKYADLGTRQKYNCTWTDLKDSTYYGGNKYGDMLGIVGEGIKLTDTNAKLISGSLEMDCKPVWQGDLDEELTKTCVGIKFFKGILLSNAMKYIDFIAVDAHDKFDAFDNAVGHYNNEVNWHNKWNSVNSSYIHGPTIIPKTTYLNAIMLQTGKGITKPIINMRAALRCKFQNFNWKYAPCEDQWDLPNFDLTKAYYVAQVNTSGLANNVALTIWDTTTDHKGNRTWLFDNNGSMSYLALRESYKQLNQANFSNENLDEKNLKQFRFIRPSDQLLVVWALQDTPVSLTLTQTVVSVTDALGQTLSPTQSISVTVKPIYISLQ